MVDQTLADGVVFVQTDGDAQFCADTIDARYQNRPLVSLEIECEQSAEAADGPEDFGAQRLADFGLKSAFERVGEIDVHACSSIGIVWVVTAAHAAQCGITTLKMQDDADTD